MRFVWSCYGFDMQNLPTEPADEILKIINNSIDQIRKDVAAPARKEDMRLYGGAIMQRLIVELRSKNIRVSVSIEPGHIMQHICGRIYLPEEWDALEVHGVTMKNIAGDGSARIPTRLCGCGKYVGYDGMSITHAEEVCNTKRSKGAVN